MLSAYFLPVSVFLLAAIIQIVTSQEPEKESLKCFVCNSARDPRCGDPFDGRTIELAVCDMFMPGKNATVCRKTVQRVSLGDRQDMRVIRTCGYEPDNTKSQMTEDEILAEAEQAKLYPNKVKDVSIPEERCYNRAGTFEVMMTYCTCHGHGCNPAPTLTMMSLIGTMATATACILMGKSLL